MFSFENGSYFKKYCLKIVSVGKIIQLINQHKGIAIIARIVYNMNTKGYAKMYRKYKI